MESKRRQGLLYKLRRAKVLNRLRDLAADNGYQSTEKMLRDLYEEQRVSIINLAKSLYITEYELRQLMRDFQIPMRSRGGPNHVVIVISPELLAEVDRDGIPAVAARMAVDTPVLRLKLQAYAEKQKAGLIKSGDV